MNGECGEQTPSGRRCFYLASECPLHSGPLVLVPGATSDAGGQIPATQLATRLGAVALERVASLELDPANVARFLRGLDLFRRFPPPPEDEDEILAEVELRGVVMNGFAPRNPEEWALARKVFDDTAIEEFTRWVRLGLSWELPDPAWTPPLPETELPPSLRGPQPDPDWEFNPRDDPATPSGGASPLSG